MLLPMFISRLGNMCVQAIKFPFYSFKGFKIGIAEREFILQAGDVITVYGTVIYSRKDNKLTFEMPSFFVDNKSFFLKRIQHLIKRRKIILYGVVIPAMIISTAILIYQMFKMSKKFLHEQKLKAIQHGYDKIKKNLTDELACILCATNPRDIIFQPCGHLSVCTLCFKNLKNEHCIFCKRKITDTIKINLY